MRNYITFLRSYIYSLCDAAITFELGMCSKIYKLLKWFQLLYSWFTCLFGSYSSCSVSLIFSVFIHLLLCIHIKSWHINLATLCPMEAPFYIFTMQLIFISFQLSVINEFILLLISCSTLPFTVIICYCSIVYCSMFHIHPSIPVISSSSVVYLHV